MHSKASMQDLCDEIQKMGSVLACYAVNRNGALLGANYGEFRIDESLRADIAQVASMIWGALDRVTPVGGPIKMVSAVFENFKILGLPVKGSNTAILLTVDVKLDSYVLADRVDDFVAYWLKLNHYVD